MSSENRSRWAIFAASVISPVDNPDAYLWRALGARLKQLGQDATFFEPRGNAALRALLHRSGSAALKDFRLNHPDVEYRTLEPRTGADLVEWMTRTLATIDVALIQSNAPAPLIEWLGKLTRPYLQTFFVDTGWNIDSEQMLPDPEILRSYSAIVAGHDRLVARYEAAMEGTVAVQSFGPLPDIGATDPPGENDLVALDQATNRLIEIVDAVRARSSAKPSGPIGPNGHRS